MEFKRIDTIDQLKFECLNKKNVYVDFFVFLFGGLARSSKRIRYNKKTDTFDVRNEIDDTFQRGLSIDDLRNKTIILEAIEKNAFYQYIYD